MDILPFFFFFFLSHMGRYKVEFTLCTFPLKYDYFPALLVVPWNGYVHHQIAKQLYFIISNCLQFKRNANDILVCKSFPAFLSIWMKLTQAAEKASIVLTQLGKYILSAQGDLVLRLCMWDGFRNEPAACLLPLRYERYLPSEEPKEREALGSSRRHLGNQPAFLLDGVMWCLEPPQPFCHHEGNPLG